MPKSGKNAVASRAKVDRQKLYAPEEAIELMRDASFAKFDETVEEAAEMAALTQIAMRVAREASGAQGFNIGMNQGAIAGAGVADHLHQHVVPRWANDTNFFPIIGGVKAIPRLLGEVREAFANAWPGEPSA